MSSTILSSIPPLVSSSSHLTTSNRFKSALIYSFLSRAEGVKHSVTRTHETVRSHTQSCMCVGGGAGFGVCSLVLLVGHWPRQPFVPAVCTAPFAFSPEVLMAVHSDGMSLEFAAEALRGNRELVTAAVHNNGLALRFAAELLRGDKEVVLAAIQNDSFALEFAGTELAKDREVVLAAVTRPTSSSCGLAIRYAAEELRAQDDVVLAAVRTSSGSALQYATDDLKSNRQVVLTAVQIHGTSLQFASADLRADRELVLAAVQSCGFRALMHSEECFHTEPGLVRIARRREAETPEIDRVPRSEGRFVSSS